MRHNLKGLITCLMASAALLLSVVVMACTPVYPGAPVASTPASPAPTAAPAPTAPPAPVLNVNIATRGGISYLVDGKGMTLYYFTKDNIGKSIATGAVLQAWPIFSVDNFVIPGALTASDFATITRDDGLKQATYKGWPLYYFANDKAPGDTAGEGVAGVWFVIRNPFYTVMLQTKPDLGNYLIDPKGMTLYYFTKDSLNKSNATSAIVQAWPVFNTASFVLPGSLQGSDFGTITRDDGKPQATYQGWPLYYYAGDRSAGDTGGQGLNGVWFVVNPQKINHATPPPPPSYGGGGGGGY